MDKILKNKTLKYFLEAAGCLLVCKIMYILYKNAAILKTIDIIYLNNNQIIVSGLIVVNKLIFGILFAILSYIIARNIRNKYIQKFILDHPKEELVCVSHPNTKATFFIQFILSGFIFGNTFLLFFFNEITVVDGMTKDNLLLYAILFIYLYIAFMYVQAYSVILTNKRIAELPKSFIKDSQEILLDEIINVEEKTALLIIKNCQITSKNNRPMMFNLNSSTKNLLLKLKSILKKDM